MGAELAFEAFGVALEATRGSAESAPTHLLNMAGKIVPVVDMFRPDDQVGELAEFERSEIVRKSATFTAEGGADTTKLPLLCNMVLVPLTAGVAAGGEVTGTTTLVGGTGYVPADGTFNITVGAPASGGRQAVIQATTTAGVITALTVLDPGSHYTSAPTLTFTGHTGTGASATAVVSTSASTAKLWEFVREMTTDTIDSATAWWGDPNVQMYETAYTMATQLKVNGDASGTDGVMQSVEGIGQFPSELTGGSIPSLPAIAVGDVLVPGRMQLWLNDTTKAFGTTEVTGRVISAECTIPTGVVAKYVATGPGGGVTYDHIGRKKAHPELKFSVELIDTDQTSLFIAGTTMKARVRFNGATAIEGSLYPFFEMDIQGKLDALDWGDLEGTNRTATFTIQGEKSAQIASDCRVRIQNSSASL